MNTIVAEAHVRPAALLDVCQQCVAMVLRRGRPCGVTLTVCLMLVCVLVSTHAQAESSAKDAPTDVAPTEASDHDRGVAHSKSSAFSSCA